MARLTARALVVAALCMVSCHAIVLEPMRGVMAGGSAPKSTAELAAAFKQDGYTIQTMHTLPTGQRGIVAESTNVTLLSTGQPKVVYYVEGTGYEMGFLHGYIAENATSILANDYLDHFIPALISWKFNKAASHSAKYSKLYDLVTDIIGDFFVSKSVDSFNKELPGTFPQPLIDEMSGIVAGAKAANPSTKVTLDRIITMNYGLDYLATQMFGGGLIKGLKEYIRATKLRDPELEELLELLEPEFFHLPVFCDAFEASGASHPPGTGPLYARSFQLVTAEVFQDYQSMFIYIPSDGRIPTVSGAAPGLVGSITGMNSEGVVMGVDTLRSSLVNIEHTGINSALLIRATLENASSTVEAIDFVVDSRRGCSYLYHILDTTEYGVVLETGAWTPNNTVPNTLDLISDEKLLAALPSSTVLMGESKPDYRHGLFVRHMNYTLPEPFLSYNAKLFELAGLPYNPSMFTNATGAVFSSFEQENADWSKIASRYFSVTRMPHDDVALLSNFAVTPQMRVSQMTFWASLFPGEAMAWRYDTLNRLLVGNYGNIDFATAREIITFLAPNRTPGYWTDTLIPNDPMSAVVEGHLVVADLKNGIFQLKGGYWSDKWLQIQLPNYA